MWEDGQDVPDVDELPSLDEIDIQWRDWFMDLDTQRSSGMSTGAIPISEIRSYCSMIDYPDELYFVRVIMAIDRRVLKESRQKAKDNRSTK